MKNSRKAIRRPRNKPLRRYTPVEQQNIIYLAESLSKILPATSQGNFCLKNIAKDRGLGKYFDDKLGNKKRKFTYFIKQVYGRHPIVFKKIINDILADAVDRRRNQGNPILKDEAQLLSDNLLGLSIDLRKEIDALKLSKERPRITPPPIEIKRVLEKIGLNPILLNGEVLKLFNDGYLNEAVRKSGEIYEAYLRKSFPQVNKYGRPLVTDIFNSENPKCDISGYHKEDILDPQDEREGYMYLAMGAIHWCKNIVSHDDVDQLAPHDAASRIILVSHLLDVYEKQGGEK